MKNKSIWLSVLSVLAAGSLVATGPFAAFADSGEPSASVSPSPSPSSSAKPSVSPSASAAPGSSAKPSVSPSASSVPGSSAEPSASASPSPAATPAPTPAPKPTTVPGADDITTTTMELFLYLDRDDVVVNHELIKTDRPPAIIDGKSYVPAKFLGDTLGFPVDWDADTNTVLMVLPNGVEIRVDLTNKSVWINEYWQPFDTAAALVDGRLMMKLTWLMDYLGASYNYDGDLRRIQIIYVKRPDGLVISPGNTRPVAKFTTDKSVYKLGEPVRYTDLSYDPDAEGLPRYEWTGKQEVFFKSGTYKITLQVTDGKGNTSAVYERKIEVTKERHFTELEYQIYLKPVGTAIKTNWTMLYNGYLNRPQLPKKVEYVEGRTLLMSDSPETFESYGILYQDVINGKGRLYADHINGMNKTAQFTIFATNKTNRDVTVVTTRKGEVFPSIYANLIGHEASVDFLMNEPVNEKLVIPAGATRVYKWFPDFTSGEGVNLFYDLETDGDVQFSFTAMEPTAKAPTSFSHLKPLAFNGHIRGTFPVSEIRWEVDGSALSETSALTFGDPALDPWVKGYDVFRQQEVQLDANFGTLYKIKVNNPKKAAILFLSRGGVFKGPLKIDGQFVMLPNSGVILPFEQMQVVHRTTGREDSIEIEFTPPAGSAFPVDLLFVPLDDRAP